MRSHDPETMPLVHAAADVLVHLATPEPLGRAVVEALAAGRPVVAAATAGPAWILRDGGGRLVPPDAPDAALQAVLALLGDPEARARAASDNPARANPFAAPRIAAALMDHLDTAAG
ncbi:MAG: glycosyltransferase [Planctomycetota bacterium]